MRIHIYTRALTHIMHGIWWNSRDSFPYDYTYVMHVYFLSRFFGIACIWWNGRESCVSARFWSINLIVLLYLQGDNDADNEIEDSQSHVPVNLLSSCFLYSFYLFIGSKFSKFLCDWFLRSRLDQEDYPMGISGVPEIPSSFMDAVMLATNS